MKLGSSFLRLYSTISQFSEYIGINFHHINVMSKSEFISNSESDIIMSCSVIYDES